MLRLLAPVPTPRFEMPTPEDAALPLHATAQQVREHLTMAFGASNLGDLQVQDDSAQHAGHAGAREGSHFTVRVVSHTFHGLSRVARHRLVYDALKPLMARGIHALAVVAQTPDEARADASAR
jgi:BolA family transcriptional regulator, general stress-responsive regulator